LIGTLATARRSVRVRWWPVVLILGLGLLAWIGIWFVSDLDRQNRVLSTFLTGFVASLLLICWLLLGSRLRWRVRWTVLALIATTLFVLVASVRIRGVSGDLVPLLEWRFSPETGARLREAQASSAHDIPRDESRAAIRLDYPQFLGPGRDGRVEGVRLDPDWSARPPRTLWRRPIGEGWSGFVVAGQTAVTQEQRDSDHSRTLGL
jgi:outer membrane protein assembly factor BamB